jgi:hypothetical protein
VCLLLQDLVQRCLHGGGGIWEDMCYERRRAVSGYTLAVATGPPEVGCSVQSAARRSLPAPTSAAAAAREWAF